MKKHAVMQTNGGGVYFAIDQLEWSILVCLHTFKVDLSGNFSVYNMKSGQKMFVLVGNVDLCVDCVFFSADEPDVKKVKLDEEIEFNFAEIAQGNVTSVRQKPAQ